ncbi:P-type conjugative transfer protein TrbG [soil metagenome]
MTQDLLKPATPLLLLALAGCAAQATPPRMALDVPSPAAEAAAIVAPHPAPVTIVEVPRPLPLPGQLKPVPAGRELEPPDPRERIARANAAARIQPSRDLYVNATQVWPWTDGALYQLYTSPGHVTDIALEPGEGLVSVSAGDTVRWIVGDTTSGTGTTQVVHILVKPVASGLATNLVINSDRRTYHLELSSTPATWMASVSWSYPADRLLALRGQNAAAAAAAPADQGLALDRLNFRYAIDGDRPSWRPVRAFDDGSKAYIQFPPGIAQGDMPPLFVVGPTGDTELVNYRVSGTYYIVDRLFAAAELRLGGKRQEVVRIARTDSVRGPRR